MKTVLFVPGFWQDLTTNDYESTIKAIEKQGYRVVFVSIQWKRTTIDDWIRELNKEYMKYEPQDTVLAGFSYGAMTVFGVAVQRLPAELWLFSLSPYFSEDIPQLKQAWLRNIGKQRQKSFQKMSFERLAPLVTCKTLLFIGDTEAKRFPMLVKRVEEAYKNLPFSQLINIPDCGHDITSKQYIAAIRHAI